MDGRYFKIFNLSHVYIRVYHSCHNKLWTNDAYGGGYQYHPTFSYAYLRGLTVCYIDEQNIVKIRLQKTRLQNLLVFATSDQIIMEFGNV